MKKRNILLASLLSFTLLSGCGSIDSSNDKESAKSDSSVIDSSSEENKNSSAEDSSKTDTDRTYIDPAIGVYDEEFYIGFEKTSDREVKTNDGKLSASFEYKVIDNTITITTTYKNLDDKEVTADFRPFITYTSDGIDNSIPQTMSTAFVARTIKPGESYTFYSKRDLGDYTKAEVTYAFLATTDSFEDDFIPTTYIATPPQGLQIKTDGVFIFEITK